MSAKSGALVAGVDLGTQSTKVVVCDVDTGTVLREARAPHPEGTEVDPLHWWEAYRRTTEDGLLRGVSAIGVGGQQHGMVTLDERGQVVRPALLWNDVRSARAASDLVADLGGPSAWAEAVGSVPLAAFTVTKLRWLAEHEPDAAARVVEVLLPHDWLTALLVGRGRVRPGTACTDRGDASGTGYWSPATGEYRPDLIEKALGRLVRAPEILAPAAVVGETAEGCLVSVGTGDNMAAALGLGLEPGDVVVSLGTSGTAYARHHAPTADSSGAVAGFADAAGQFLPLVCTLNAARVLTSAATMLGTDLPGLESLALDASPGAEGLVLLPYLDGERTPDLPFATGTLAGLTRGNATPANIARASVEGMLCGLADGVDALRAHGVRVGRVLLIGGAARSAAVQAVAPDLFGVPVAVPSPAEYVALGAARQAAWALAAQQGETGLPAWEVPLDAVVEPGDADHGASIREAYGAVRNRVHPPVEQAGELHL